MKSRSLILIAAALVVGATVFFIGRYSAPSAAGRSESSTNKPLADASEVRHAGDAGGEGLSQRGESAPTGAKVIARMEAIVRNEDAMARNRDFIKFVSQLSPGDFEAVETHFRSLVITESRKGEYIILLNAWTQADPVKAVEYVLAKANPFGTALNTVLGAWAAKDPDAAIAWATASHPGTNPNPFMGAIIPAIAATDTNRATTLLTAMPNSPERGVAIDGFLNQLRLRNDPDASRQWIDSLTDTTLRNACLGDIARQLAATDPAGAAKWLMANPGEAANDALGSVVGLWAESDLPAASSYFNSLPSGDIRAITFCDLVNTVTKESPQAGAALLDKYPADAAAGVIRSFVWNSLDGNPELALSYVSRLPDAKEQEETYSKTLRNWMDRDPTKAKAWLQTHPVPQSVLQNLQGQEAP